jgi:uncharacterized iron-regulated membrane protein
MLLVILTGLTLQFKKQSAWIQPKTESGKPGQLALQWAEVLKATQSVDSANVASWEDIDRLDVRPGKGVIKVRCKNRWEVQLDSVTGEVLSSAYRRSDLIESLHDGSFFSDYVKLYVFSANGFILLGLWITGAWLWYLPLRSKMKKKKRLANEERR